jgi:hypothetical protein
MMASRHQGVVSLDGALVMAVLGGWSGQNYNGLATSAGVDIAGACRSGLSASRVIAGD